MMDIKFDKTAQQRSYLSIMHRLDRTLEAGACVVFDEDMDDRITAISMTKPDDGDFDFEDLKLTRVG